MDDTKQIKTIPAAANNLIDAWESLPVGIWLANDISPAIIELRDALGRKPRGEKEEGVADINEIIARLNKDLPGNDFTLMENHTLCRKGKPLRLSWSHPEEESSEEITEKTIYTSLLSKAGREVSKAFHREYEERHAVCPKCGERKYITTMMCYTLDLSKPEEYQDRNRCTCNSCGHVCTTHDLVPRSKE